MKSSAKAGDPGALRTPAEVNAAALLAQAFEHSSDSTQMKLDNFPKYVRLQALTRFMVRHELFKKVLNVKGSVVECGVFAGGGLMSWANLSAILEPADFQRRIYGFDSFEGFPNVTDKDRTGQGSAQTGQLRSNSFEELNTVIEAYDANRYLGHMKKVELIKGDACQTIPAFLNSHPHLVVSLLFMDFDLYEPTKAALEAFFPRMPKGAVIAFDELDHPVWPGETLALAETLGVGRLRLQRFDFDPYISYAVLE